MKSLPTNWCTRSGPLKHLKESFQGAYLKSGRRYSHHIFSEPFEHLTTDIVHRPPRFLALPAFVTPGPLTWHGFFTLGNSQYEPFAKSKVQALLILPITPPGICYSRACPDAEPHLFEESWIWSSPPEQPLLNLCSTVYPFLTLRFLKVFLVLSIFMFIITFAPHDIWKWNKAFPF